jgi:glycosyltransferase involved in cell wall biosynthesis
VVFTAGRLVKQKNHELMIRGFSIVAKSRHDAYLCIAGEGGLRQELEAEVRALGLEGRVIFLGGRKDIHRFYTVADSFLLTSRHEGFCIAAMEALAFGLPVVSTRVAGVEEYLVEGKNGFFIESTPESIAITLQRVIELPEGLRKRMGEAGKDTAESFSVKRYGEAFNAILTSVE